MLKIGSCWVLFELFVADGPALVEQRMRAKAEDVVILGVTLLSGRGGAQRACKEVGPGCCRGGFLGGVVTHRPVKFMD